MLKSLKASCVLLALIVSTGLAARGPMYPNNSNNQNNNNNNNNNNSNNNQNLQYPPPIDTTPAQDDRKKLNEARATAAKVQGRFNGVMAKLKAEFDSAPEHKTIVVAAQQSQAAYDAIREKTLASLHASADYKFAAAARDQLAVQLASAGDDADRPQIAQQRLEAGKKLTAMEVDALDANPQAADAHQKLIEAGAKYATLLQEFQQSIKGNSDWQAVKTDLDKAKADVTAADRELNAELAREADAEQQRQAQIAQINRQRLEQSGKGNRSMAPPAQ